MTIIIDRNYYESYNITIIKTADSDDNDKTITITTKPI